MKIQTQNRLAHYQVELMELTERNNCLMNQINPKKAQIAQMEAYLKVNQGDRRMMNEYKKETRELNTLCNQVTKNNRRIMTLQSNIYREQQRIQNRMYS